MKKALSVLLIVFLALLLLPGTASAAETVESGACGPYLTWTLDEEGTITISGTGEMWDEPSDFEQVSASISSVVIEEGVSSVGESAFHDCTNLTSVILPDSVAQVGFAAFSGCTSLREITLSRNLTVLKGHLFEDCTALERVDIPRGVERIEDQVFQNCISLVSVTIPDTVFTIRPSAFTNCESLEQVTIPGSVQTIWKSAFSGCTGLTELVICDGVDTIGSYAFQGCVSLEWVTIPASVISVEESAFSACTGLNGIFFEGDAPVLEQDCFRYIRTAVYYPAGNDTWTEDILKNYGGRITWLSVDASCGHTQTELMDARPATCTEYGYTGDQFCNQCGQILLLGWELPMLPHAYLDSVCTACGTGYVAGSQACGPNVRWTLEEGGTLRIYGTGDMWDIEYLSPFEDLGDSIREIVIEEGVRSVGAYAFYYFEQLTQVTLPSSLAWIGENAFYGCSSLREIAIPDGVITIEDDAFSGCSSLTNVTLPDSVTEIEWGAFAGCSSLTTLDLPAGLTRIGEEAFSGCSSLTGLVLPDQVNDIDWCAFAGCSSLDRITFTGNAPSFHREAFKYFGGTCYYPSDNAAWTEEVRQNYAGNIRWEICTHTYADGQCTHCGIPEDPVQRLGGGNRFETAFMAAEQMKVNLGVDKFDAVVVASCSKFPDALSGSYLAAVKNAPILLACNESWLPDPGRVESINEDTMSYIKENLKPGGTIYLLGGNTAVPPDFAKGLNDFNVIRLAGTNRYLTNLKILEEAGIGDRPVLVCTGNGFADSLSASAAMLPILLVTGDALTEEQEAFLETVQGTLYIIGGTSAVSEAMEAKLKTYGSVERLAGADRFATSVLVAETFFEEVEAAVLAYGWNFPDGLCGGPLATTMGAPLLLAMEGWEASAAAYVQSQSIAKGVIMGSDELISDRSADLIFGLQ